MTRNKRSKRHGVCAILMLALGVTVLWLPAQGASPQEYDRALSQVQDALSRQAQAVQRGTLLPPAQFSSAVGMRVLAPIDSVNRPGLAPQPIDPSLLLAAIRNAEAIGPVRQRVAGLHAASAQIAALRRDILAPNPAPQGAENAARAVLSARLYDSDPLPPPSLFDRFSAWLERMLRRLFHRSAPTVPDVNINPAFVKGIVIVLLTSVFAAFVAVLVQWLRRRPARPQPLSLDGTEAALVEARDTDSLRALAEQKAQQGDYRLALRFVYLALLVTLDTNGVLRFDRSKTNWEYLRLLRGAGRSDVYDAMTPLTREFDRIWYGFASADSADYARALTQYDALQAASKLTAA